jgi:hypothetical protein
MAQYKAYEYKPNSMLRLVYECPSCHSDNDVTVNEYKFEDWSCGTMNIQTAFPELSAAKREIMITGICDPCFKSRPKA